MKELPAPKEVGQCISLIEYALNNHLREHCFLPTQVDVSPRVNEVLSLFIENESEGAFIQGEDTLKLGGIPLVENNRLGQGESLTVLTWEK